MNITDAYRRYTGTRTVRNPQYRGVMGITYEFLETILELPQGVHIRAMQPNMMTNTIDVMIYSDTLIDGITYEVGEGMMTPGVDINRYIRYIQVGNGIRPRVGFSPEDVPPIQIRERAMDPIISDNGIARISMPDSEIE